MIHALASGSLWDSPERRQSKAGKDFVSCTLKLKDGDEIAWLKILAFSETAQDALMQLRSGEALSVTGTLKADIYKPEGREPRISLTVFAEAILPLRAPKKAKAPPVQKPNANRSETEQSPPRAAPAFDDGFPEAWGGPE